MAITAKIQGREQLQVKIGGGASRGSITRLVDVDLYADAWQGSESPYSQIVQIEGVTINSKVDLQPSVEQLSVFHNKDLAFTTENEDGVVTVYAIGDKPSIDYTIQATVTEVSA